MHRRTQTHTPLLIKEYEKFMKRKLRINVNKSTPMINNKKRLKH